MERNEFQLRIGWNGTERVPVQGWVERNGTSSKKMERSTTLGTPMMNWDGRYLCHFSTEMAEIWSPGTSFQDVWTCKISALYLLYFHSYESFCGVFSGFD